jgi:hypothetical protein
MSRDVNGYVLNGFNLHVCTDGCRGAVNKYRLITNQQTAMMMAYHEGGYKYSMLLPVLSVFSSDRCQASRIKRH